MGPVAVRVAPTNPPLQYVRGPHKRTGTGQPPDRAAIIATIAASSSRELVRRLHTERRESIPPQGGNCVSPFHHPNVDLQRSKIIKQRS
jgi:hypothetical protein